MKKILLLLLISFIAKPDYSGVGVSLASNGDADIVGIGYEQVTSKLSFGVSYGRAEVGSISGNVYGVGLAYAFTDFNTGSFFVDVDYINVDVLGVSVSDTNFGLGYAKASGKRAGGWWVVNKANGHFKYVPASGLDMTKEVKKISQNIMI